MKTWFLTLFLGLVAVSPIAGQEMHDHPAPEKLGKVSFPTSCAPMVQPQFERAVALLHSFAYSESERAFREVAARDPKCAMAHWGVAMTYFHQLWEPRILTENLARGQAELSQVSAMDATPREKQYLAAISAYYGDSDKLDAQTRAAKYLAAMREVRSANPNDTEASVFYALALLSTASPMDKTHPNEKEAAAILEPLYKALPDHPGIAHYLIHSYDSAELAALGLPAARQYSKIAPSAPHALHMPSHIFTRLGYWDDSIASNIAARDAARRQGDIGEELHAMDYLAYAYLQKGSEADARRVLDDLATKKDLRAAEFKIGYASTAMPVRFAVERGRWEDAAALQSVAGTPPHVAAIVFWARALGWARSGKPDLTEPEIAKLQECLQAVRLNGNEYWTAQTQILLQEAQAWSAHARGRSGEAIALLRSAADSEDAIEKLPVTPGPIVPAREQLGEMLLIDKKPADALRELEVSLQSAPGRRGALLSALQASEQLGDRQKAEHYRTALGH